MTRNIETQRAQQKRQRSGAHYPCNLFITNHDGRNTFRLSLRTAVQISPICRAQANLTCCSQKSPPVRPELLKIDGRLLEVRVRLNPRARRMIVKVNPATGEISVTAPSRRGLSAALDFARGERDWIAGQLAKVPGPVMLMRRCGGSVSGRIA